jgi:hypothetical protein
MMWSSHLKSLLALLFAKLSAAVEKGNTLDGMPIGLYIEVTTYIGDYQ